MCDWHLRINISKTQHFLLKIVAFSGFSSHRIVTWSFHLLRPNTWGHSWLLYFSKTYSQSIRNFYGLCVWNKSIIISFSVPFQNHYLLTEFLCGNNKKKQSCISIFVVKFYETFLKSHLCRHMNVVPSFDIYSKYYIQFCF